MILHPDDITEIHKQALPLGLQNKRDLPLYGVNIEYIAGLPIRGNPSDQLLSDLQNMNQDGEIIGGVPLERWLHNAASGLSIRPDKQKFFRDFEIKAANTAAAPQAPVQPAGMQQERILFDSDLLPFGVSGRRGAHRKIDRAAERPAV